jgi:hypothetical protein
MKKVPQKIKDIVIDTVQKHIQILGFQNYRVDIDYMEYDKKGSERYADDVCLAECFVDRRYLNATISIYPSLIQRYLKRRVHQVFCTPEARIQRVIFLERKKKRFF